MDSMWKTQQNMAMQQNAWGQQGLLGGYIGSAQAIGLLTTATAGNIIINPYNVGVTVKPAKESNLAWLDRRVNEMRVSL